MGDIDALPDFIELDVFLGQHILLTLEQHFSPNISSLKATNTDCKPKLHKNYKLVLQI